MNKVKEYLKEGKLIREYQTKIVKITKSYYINIPIDFIRTNNLKARDKLKIIDNYDFLVVRKL